MKNIFTKTDLVLIGATVLLAATLVVSFVFDLVEIGANGIIFNF